MVAGSEAVYQFIFDDIKKKLDDPSVIYTLHDRIADFDPIPCDVATIDELLEGGLPEGRIIELFGPEASGKTTVMLHFVAAAQRRGYIVYFIDAEQSLDLSYAKRIGVDPEKLLFSQPDYGEQALETARVICESTGLAKEKYGPAGFEVRTLIVIDSIPALVPKEAFTTYEKDGYDSSVALGGQARMMAKLVPPLVTKAGKAGATVVFINQERDKIGVVYGSPTTTPGGRTVKFFASLRLKVQRIGYYEQGGTRTGIRTQMIPIKSKLFPIHGKRAEFIIGSDGINTYAAMAETLVSRQFATKKGSWISIGERKVQGIPNLEKELREDKEFCAQMEALLSGSGGQTKPIELKPVEPKPEKIAAPVQPSQAPAEKSKGIRVIGARPSPSPSDQTIMDGPLIPPINGD